jgi:intraflagellar transport protein 52
LKKLKEVDLLLLGGPRLPFTAQELQDIRKYVDDGGRVLLFMGEGGEQKLQTNINAMLE